MAQRLQYPIIKEYTIECSRILNKILRYIFLDQGILESAGVSEANVLRIPAGGSSRSVSGATQMQGSLGL